MYVCMYVCMWQNIVFLLSPASHEHTHLDSFVNKWTDPARLSLLAKWLNSIYCGEYVQKFFDAGFDDITALSEHGLTEADLDSVCAQPLSESVTHPSQ